MGGLKRNFAHTNLKKGLEFLFIQFGTKYHTHILVLFMAWGLTSFMIRSVFVGAPPQHGTISSMLRNNSAWVRAAQCYTVQFNAHQ